MWSNYLLNEWYRQKKKNKIKLPPGGSSELLSMNFYNTVNFIVQTNEAYIYGEKYFLCD